MDLPLNFEAALDRLDADIEAAEARLNDLQLKRTGALAFLDYLRSGESATPASKTASGEARSTSRATASASSVGPTELVLAALRRMSDDEFNLDRLQAEIEEHGGVVEREQTRNSVHYLVRKGDLRNARRGVYVRPTDTEAPVSAGASVGITHHDMEGGGSYESSAQVSPSPQVEGFLHPQLGASIVRSLPG